MHPEMANSMQNPAKRNRFSRLLRHSARKQDGLKFVQRFRHTVLLDAAKHISEVQRNCNKL